MRSLPITIESIKNFAAAKEKPRETALAVTLDKTLNALNNLGVPRGAVLAALEQSGYSPEEAKKLLDKLPGDPNMPPILPRQDIKPYPARGTAEFLLTTGKDQVRAAEQEANKVLADAKQSPRDQLHAEMGHGLLEWLFTWDASTAVKVRSLVEEYRKKSTQQIPPKSAGKETGNEESN
jgi:hypothetical protein